MFGQVPNVIVTVTEVKGRITLVVRHRHDPYSPLRVCPPGFSSVSTGQSDGRVYVREVGNQRLSDIRDDLLRWLQREALHGIPYPLPKLEEGLVIKVFYGRAEVCKPERGKTA